MSWRNKVKNNTPKVELHSIDSLIAGSYKTGKTRLWKEATELHYASPEDVLLLAFEAGYETWELDNIIPIHQEGSDEELWKVWEFFKKEVVPGLVKEAKENRVTKLLGIDTADRCIDAATAWVLRDRSKKYGVTGGIASLQALGEASKNAENGYTALYDEMKKPFDALKNAGYGKMSLAWTKEKETTLYNGMKYNSIELMMHATGRKIFESQASLICCLFNEVSVLDKSGNEMNENIKDKKQREKGSNFHETRTVMVFRPTEYISIAGGRYTDLPEEPVEYNAQNFLKVFEDAVKGQLKKTTKNIEELKIEQEQERNEQAKEYAEQVEEQKSVGDLVAQIEAETKRFTSNNLKEKVVPTFTELFGTPNYRKVEDIELLEKALIFIKSVE
ncbi:AAA family ATPase [Paenibacillus sp. ISL-20]|uniref:AAA family ATPase n=1 Tax=Paenibacillus sp. ISL-20 TaxID=2819163 RepID=UPI001BEC17E8|nr:AAA family ATPase [Paenibacillus sp. ISL-20]MBT2759914.1 AAA family ATPase [Paenibacillus sp. ISL-20]